MIGLRLNSSVSATSSLSLVACSSRSSEGSVIFWKPNFSTNVLYTPCMSFLMSSLAANTRSKSALMSLESSRMARCSPTVVHESSMAWALWASIASILAGLSMSISAERLAEKVEWLTLYSARAAL